MRCDDTTQITFGHEVRHGLGVDIVRATGGEIHGARIILNTNDGTQRTMTRIAGPRRTESDGVIAERRTELKFLVCLRVSSIHTVVDGFTVTSANLSVGR